MLEGEGNIEEIDGLPAGISFPQLVCVAWLGPGDLIRFDQLCSSDFMLHERRNKTFLKKQSQTDETANRSSRKSSDLMENSCTDATHLDKSHEQMKIFVNFEAKLKEIKIKHTFYNGLHQFQKSIR